MKISKKYEFSEREVDRIIGMAWEDRTPFEAIKTQFGLKEDEVVRLMRQELKPSSWKMWRKRVNSRKTKHLKLRNPEVSRFRCKTQKNRY
ncbi:TIGR03643 family protein [Candidatus Uabimicrobium amorphum]|uniref:TIGR03643 family protein n=1 Tax=Uabimicrobium amorphum TaxID=2596890 RepID=UPI0021BCD92B|nr:TIGR03643 family protein [Candidatus Uabimicrobium amorphum]